MRKDFKEMTMFREKEDAYNSNITANPATTVLKEDAVFEGKLTFEGSVLVNGKLKGEIYSSGDLTVGKSGYIEGTVEIGTITINGEVRGNIKAKQKIVINAPAVVRGDITAPSLIIDEGAIFEGNCSMGRNVANNTENKVIEFQKTDDTF